MTPVPPRLRLILLAALLAAFCGPASAQDTAATPPARTVEGIATDRAGKPLERVTLYLFGLPPGQTDMITLGDQSTVVTDDRGRFTWAVPAALPPLSDYIGVRSIDCYALAADRGAVRFRLALRPNLRGTDREAGEQSLLARETRACETRWQTGGPKPIFSVIVPDTAAVLLSVRGPDGEPLRSREVEAVPIAPEPVGIYGGAMVYTGRTDREGRLRLRCFPCSQRFEVFATGLGFGSTGTVVAGPGQSVAPALPPLAPFAELSGTVTPSLAGAGAAVHVEDFSDETDWYDPRAPVAADGRWTLAGVLPGQHRLTLTDGQPASGSASEPVCEPVSISVQPGQQIGGIVIGPKKPVTETDTRATAPAEAALSVRGRVLDAGGGAVAGADVYAVFAASEERVRFSGGRGQQVLTAKTDAAGAYLIPGLPVGDGPRGTSVHLVARRAGCGLALGDGESEKEPLSGRWMDIRKDLVLPASHSGLTVRVLQAGKPVPNVLVALTAPGENSVIPERYREADRGEAAQALRKMLAPSGKTGPDGIVRFRDLSPGLWDVTANRDPSSPSLFEAAVPPFNVSTGVVVQAGASLSYTLSLLPTPGGFAFRVLGPDGLPPPVAPTSLTLKTAQYPNYGSLELTPDGAGNGVGQFIVPGLFQVTARFGDRPLDNNALAGPYFEGTAWVAVSPATASSRPVVLPTHRIGPASLRVRLQDAGGRPLRGTVTVGDPFNSALYAASVGADGVAVFPNMPQNFFRYTVTAHIDGRPERAGPSPQGGPLPSDAALIAGTGQPLPQAVYIKAGEETSVTFGPVPTGYVRLHLTGPFASAKGIYIEGRQTDDEAFTEAQFDPATGEYLVGPLPEGRRTLRLERYVPAPVEANLPAGEAVVTVKAGQVVHATVSVLSTAADELLHTAPLVGTVYLPDGKTPAWGARAAIFLTDWSQPFRMARTDTQGRLVLKDYWRESWSSGPLPDPPTVPVLAAWLPGANGAVILPYHPGQDERLVLPAPVTLRGRITVGGRTVLGLSSSFRVRAAYQGRGALNEALSVEATAEADGTFTLAGLTPGVYQVQAARDDIWLSGTQPIIVAASPLPPLTLDIAPPGDPVLLHLSDPAGRALPGRTVLLNRPVGPLTDLLWPQTVTADANGNLRLDGLEAGRQTIEGTASFLVLPLSGPSGRTPEPQGIVLAGPAAGKG